MEKGWEEGYKEVNSDKSPKLAGREPPILPTEVRVLKGTIIGWGGG